MRKMLVILMSTWMVVLMASCGASKEKSATYVLTTVEEGMFSMTDTQTLKAKGDTVYEILNVTTVDFETSDASVLEPLVSYYDKTMETFRINAPAGVEVSYSHEGDIYIMTFKLDLAVADVQTLYDEGYLLGLDGENQEKATFVSFKQTCAELKASGYTLKE